jgi:hypothetical protein
LLLNEQRALTFARQRNLKAVTVPEFIVYLYQTRLLSYRSALAKLEGIAANTGQRVMQAAWQAFVALHNAVAKDETCRDTRKPPSRPNE